MHTRCPHCGDRHDCDELAPRETHRCPACDGVFDPVGIAVGAPADDPAQGTLFGAPPKPRRARRLPRFARAATRPAARARARWWLAAAALALALCAQSVLADRARLAGDARWRPALAAICAALRCELPPWRAPAQFTLTTRDVRPHPSVPNALLITAGFRNDAPFAQAWPALELAMSDLDEREIGLRRFTAGEYLGAPPAADTLAPGQSANATLEIVDPGKAAVAFSFEFR